MNCSVSGSDEEGSNGVCSAPVFERLSYNVPCLRPKYFVRITIVATVANLTFFQSKLQRKLAWTKEFKKS